MNLFCIGLSHHTANVETRERYALPGDADFRQRCGLAEAIVLATCNRVEVYAATGDVVSEEEIARQLLRDGFENGSGTSFYRHSDAECARHLFRVVSGLDSMVLGETEIFGQAKRAYEAARESGAAGPSLHRLFQRAFRVAKQVRTRTEITRGAVSVGSVAVDLAGKIFGDLTNRKVLLLGAGEASEKTARALVSRGVSDLRVSNRSLGRAESLASLVGGRALEFERWPNECLEIDILITSTSAADPFLTREILAPIISGRRDRPLFLIDIAVPRDVAPDVNELEGVYLYDIDSLQSIAEQSLALRRQQIAAAEEIIAEHVALFGKRSEGNCAARVSMNPAISES